jgi:exopolysaccharide biosynthesis polyprenyl glycosylphosphotransferase
VYSHNLALERMQRLLVDGIAIFVAALIAVWIRHSSGWIPNATPAPWSIYLFPAAALAVITVLILYFAGSYRGRGRVAPSPILPAALGAAIVIALSASFFYREQSYSRVTVILFLPVAVVVVTGMRFVYDRYVHTVWQTQTTTRNVLIVGKTSTGRQIARTLTRQPAYYRIAGFLDDSPTEVSTEDRPNVIGPISSLGETIEARDIDEVIICITEDPDSVLDAIGECMRRKVTWRAVPNMYGLRIDRVSVDSFGGVPLVGSRGTSLVGFHRTQKRAFDIGVAAVALVLLSPILLAVALAVRLTSRGPILYRQTRVGINGRTFTMLKFRSMKTGSSTMVHDSYAREWIYGRTGRSGESDTDASVATLCDQPAEIHKMTEDSRITPVGKILRAASLDELPQFWNVLRGDMSVVGPRPALPYEVERYTEQHKRRLEVQPGITGAWQVSGRSDLPFDKMIALDVEYIERWSITTDFAIVLRTVPAILRFGGK